MLYGLSTLADGNTDYYQPCVIAIDFSACSFGMVLSWPQVVSLSIRASPHAYPPQDPSADFWTSFSVKLLPLWYLALEILANLAFILDGAKLPSSA